MGARVVNKLDEDAPRHRFDPIRFEDEAWESVSTRTAFAIVAVLAAFAAFAAILGFAAASFI